MSSQRKSSQCKGFTLVELAIVLVIIGLLVAGLLKGQEIIRNSQTKATLSQAESFRAAYYTFRDTYRAIPGDMNNATAIIRGCNAAQNCANGDGNGIIGQRMNNSAGATGTIENTLFWKHLVLSGLISSVDPSAPTAPANIAFGISHPSAPLGGGWNAIMTDLSGLGDYGGPGVIFQLSGQPNRNATAINAVEAEYIDRKLDDGQPNSGSVTAEWSSTSNCDNDSTNTYRTDIQTGECILYVGTR
jgi:prepilin-type N-terminal cleavage/methylation domain-containing protein